MAADDTANEYARNLREGLDRLKENKAAAAGEQLLKKDYARVAHEQAPGELNSLGGYLKAGTEAANSTPGLPRHTYVAGSHRVYAGKFAIVPGPILGLDFYRLDVAVGLQPNADQFMDLNLASPVEPVVWHFLASADDGGFFWFNVESKQRVSSEEIGSAAFERLSTLLLQDAVQ